MRKIHCVLTVHNIKYSIVCTRTALYCTHFHCKLLNLDAVALNTVGDDSKVWENIAHPIMIKCCAI